MKQSRRMSVLESMINVAVGYGVALAAQVAIFPMFGIHVGMVTQAKIGVAFTAVSLVRSYALRRLFAELHHRGFQ